MDTQPLLAYNIWLALPHETRKKLEALFEIPKTGEVRVTTGRITNEGNIGSEVMQDGHSAKDLYAITKEKMQEFTGIKSDDFYLLFDKTVERLNNPPTVMEEVKPKGKKKV